ncbi:hypothetical protein [Accumulibacter sp.]|uniref:hypothetical protein n=1 Tax=Accumulibacter sp. TaxID=2053492 RepID=UPI0035B3A4EA
MKELKSLVTVPFCTPSEVVTRPGYHAATCTYAAYDPDLMDAFPLQPDRGALVAALRQIWRPWCAFKFSTAEDRGAMLAAIIGALARPGLADAPGVLMDAPCPGSGKTICAAAVGALLLGRRAPVTPFSGVDDAELKKQMVANALDGFDWLLLDNVVGLYDSAVMAAVLTGGALRDRVLGSSLMFDGEIRLNVFLTSNNAALSRDLHRRFIRVRLDTGVECPQALEFPFNPVDRALTERLVIARAVCVVVQGFFAADSPRLGRGDAGFATWSRLVRDCVLWCQREGLSEEAGIGPLGDPAHQIIVEAGRSDPSSQALGLLLHGLQESLGDDWFYARDVMTLVASPVDQAGNYVKEALETMCPSRGQLNAKTVGNLLKYRVDTHCDGLVLRMADGQHKTNRYLVVRC